MEDIIKELEKGRVKIRNEKENRNIRSEKSRS